MPAFVNTEEYYEDVDYLVMKQLPPFFVIAELTVEFMYYCITKTFVFLLLLFCAL